MATTSKFDFGLINDQIKAHVDQIANLQNGLAIIVDGDTASVDVPIGGYAYVKNNIHGLSEGLYKNTSSSAFPISGGTADFTVFTKIPNGINNYLPKTTSNYTYRFADGVSVNAYSELNIGDVYSIFNLPSYARILGIFIRNTTAIQTTFNHYATGNILYIRTGAAFTPDSNSRIVFYALYI